MSKNLKIKITKTGRIMRMLDMFEVIELAEKEWEEPYKKGEFEFGKCVIVFKDNECNCITYVIQSLMPMPYHIKDIDPKDFERTYRKLENALKEQGLTIIKSKKRVFEDAPEDIKEEIKNQIKSRGFNI